MFKILKVLGGDLNSHALISEPAAFKAEVTSPT